MTDNGVSVDKQPVGGCESAGSPFDKLTVTRVDEEEPNCSSDSSIPEKSSDIASLTALTK